MNAGGKVFCIGFHKTGTTSLAEALRVLGYSVTGPNFVEDRRILDQALALALEVANRYDAFQDNPWPILYKEMDEAFPGSKFILTTRPTDRWIRSVVKHFGKKNTPMRQWIYGVGHPEGNERIYVERYDAHYAEVREYFQERPNDLLEFPLTDGAGWTELCPFLGKPIPETEFPKLNTVSIREEKEKLTPKRAYWRLARKFGFGKPGGA